MKYLPVLLLAGFSCLSCARPVSEDRDFISQLQQKEAEAQKADMSGFVRQLQQGSLSRENGDFLHQLQARQQAPYQAAAEKPTPAIQYFASFSIPRPGLSVMLSDAARLNIPVNIRGMINNDFHQTVSAIYDLTREGNRGGVQINPKAFRQYGVTVVPVLIVTCGRQTDRVAGDISIEGLLQKVAEGGECAAVAKQALKEDR